MDANEPMKVKIAKAQSQKIPYMVVLGDKEVEERVVSVRDRSEGDLGQWDRDQVPGRDQGRRDLILSPNSMALPPMPRDTEGTLPRCRFFNERKTHGKEEVRHYAAKMRQANREAVATVVALAVIVAPGSPAASGWPTRASRCSPLPSGSSGNRGHLAGGVLAAIVLAAACSPTSASMTTMRKEPPMNSLLESFGSDGTLDMLIPLAPLVLFLLVALVVSIIVRARSRAAGGSFVNRYFIGNRALGGFVLAMTTIATYGSVSSFVGGPARPGRSASAGCTWPWCR